MDVDESLRLQLLAEEKKDERNNQKLGQKKQNLENTLILEETEKISRRITRINFNKN